MAGPSSPATASSSSRTAPNELQERSSGCIAVPQRMLARPYSLSSVHSPWQLISICSIGIAWAWLRRTHSLTQDSNW
jgi:hypothetical protein